MENSDLLDTTIKCLEMTFKVIDKNVRLEAEKKLKELENDIYQHVKTIMYILKDNNSISSKLTLNLFNLFVDENKLSVVIYLKNMIKKKIDNIELPKVAAMEVIATYSDFVIHSKFSKKLHDNIVVTLVILLNYSLLEDESKYIPFIYFNT